MSSMTRGILLLVGGVLFGIGMILGLIPMSQDGTNCGSSFAPNGSLFVSGRCTDELSSRRGIALALAIPGGLLLIAGGGMILGKSEAVA